MPKPLLSIGIIFKNEIRCLERCMKSFEPLRKMVPCELVAADTGSDDGSRETAEKYADILFDFPWVNDFSAARNAVIDRCSGKWFLSVDADEWLDGDISELVEFLQSPKRRRERVGSVIVRNYYSEPFRENSSGRMEGLRLMRMSSKLRYVMPIHEYFPVDVTREPLIHLSRTILNHDGYVNFSVSERGKSKRARNLVILRKQLEDERSGDIRTLVQYLDSAITEPDFPEYLYETIKAVKEKRRSWAEYGPSALRHAINFASGKGLPELDEWIALAKKLYPKSYFVNFDIAYILANHYWKNNEFDACLRWCEIYRKAVKDFHAGRGDMPGLLFGTLMYSSEGQKRTINSLYGKALCRCGRSKEAIAVLEQEDPSAMNNQAFSEYLKALLDLHAGDSLIRLHSRISAPDYPEKAAKQQRLIYLRGAASTFSEAYREREAQAGTDCQHDYALFAPLCGQSEIGIAAVLMDTEDANEAGRLLGMVENWDYLPIAALEHALIKGVCFPPSGMELPLEALDKLAGRLAQNPAALDIILEQAVSQENMKAWPALVWARGLTLAAAQRCDWKDKEYGLRLARRFAETEQAFLCGCYTPEVLREGNLFALPPLHRFGWYCVQAFGALDAGDPAGYVRLLREGMHSCERMKPMVEFLTEHTPELQPPPPSPELLALAETVRTMLSAYPPDDPAVTALKASPVYQKVAQLPEFLNMM